MIRRVVPALLTVALATSLASCTVQMVTYDHPAPPRYDGPADYTTFYDALAPYGRWFEYRDYGWVWTPYDTPVGWRPYEDGHWSYTDDGWMWVADEPWGWAPFHYGRWFFDEDYGWVWVPGNEWAPAWVAWRQSDDYVGWAPLPPGVEWSADAGLALGGHDLDRDIPEHGWCFVRPAYLADPHVHDRMAPGSIGATIVVRTKLTSGYGAQDRYPVNRGPDVHAIERLSGHPVTLYKVGDEARPDRPTTSGQFMNVYRPVVKPIAGRVPAVQPPTPVAASDQEVQARRAQKDKELQDYEQAQQRKLDQQHRQELAHLPQGVSADEVRARHQQENQALQQHVQLQRKVVDARLQKRILKQKPAPAKHQDAKPGQP